MSRSYRALLACIVICMPSYAGLAYAGSVRWWELYTKDEQAKIFVEYEKYLYPTPHKAGLPESFRKATAMYFAVPGHENKIINAQMKYKPLVDKALKEKDYAASQFYASARLSLLVSVYHLHLKSKGTLTKKLPDHFIDEYIWTLSAGPGGRDTGAYQMLGDFGPRAKKAIVPIREAAIKLGDQFVLQDAKNAIDKIQKDP